MKYSNILPLMCLMLVSDVSSECFSTKLGYPCCSIGYPSIYTDNDGYWSVENGEWCGVADFDTVAKCWSAKFGYKCCPASTEVFLEDEDGQWGVLDKNWCGIIKTPEEKPIEIPDQTDYNFDDVEVMNWECEDQMELPSEGYMSKLKVVNTCPPELKQRKDGITYSKPEKITYHSNTTNSDRKMNIILPPNYSTEKKYPVLYYLHGILSNEDGLLEDGMGTIEIYNNLLSEGKIKEMIIVLPNTYAPADGIGVAPSFTQEHFDGYDNFINELINEIMPYIKSNYSVATGRDNTAIAGFSMGGRNTLYIGYSHPELFGYIGAFSPAPGVLAVTEGQVEHQGLMKPEDLKIDNEEYLPYVVSISVGTKDFVVTNNPESYHKALAANNQTHIWYTIPGANHDGDAVSAGYYNFISSLWGVLNN
ncbi:carbohydrate esterase family 1 protein [Piromyces sp. E2]|nr:carbohydrate esterase family 1 protein [Piromyces sp. E2]|eukprot:OUM61617.1 carbohydrate esterase family 1 protein [Piromyces sp. E2]